ncbi:CD209 antigen-like protein C [Penaeus japonicus]|uniref:CD209 antigen-like protein C n=1 Tax=Penaeus japonicus TaxID=27405 RepID=UPI001C71412D|nr:CD209 antigen-like protein C [Penaeus japonicus]
MRLAGFLWMVAGAAWALEGSSVGGLYEEHFPPIQPNCTQSLTDLLLLRQEVQLKELKQESSGILREILTEIKGSLARTPTSTGASCPGNFAAHGDTCLYLAKDTDVTWEAARLFCQDLGGDLAVFEDANAFVNALGYIKGSAILESLTIWVGGSDLSLEGEWKWISGEDMPRGTPFWGDYYQIREPGGGPRENCAVMHGLDGFLLHDTACSLKYKPLCEVKRS